MQSKDRPKDEENFDGPLSPVPVNDGRSAHKGSFNTPTRSPTSTPFQNPSMKKRLTRLKEEFDREYDEEMSHDQLVRQYKELQQRQKEHEEISLLNETLKDNLRIAERNEERLLKRIEEIEM